jgi:hypothetical protein
MNATDILSGYDTAAQRVVGRNRAPQVAPGVSKEGRYLGIGPGPAPFGGFGGESGLGEHAALECS